MSDEYQRFHALSGKHSSDLLFQILESALVNLLDYALQVANEAEQSTAIKFYFKAPALADISSKYAEAEQYDKALQIANTIEEDSEKARALADISSKYVEVGQYDKALQIANTIEHDSQKAFALADIAGKYVEVGKEIDVNTLHEIIAAIE